MMKLKIVNIFFYILISIKSISGLNVLCVFPMVATSHWLVGSSICRTLADAGHNVTIISPFQMKNPPKRYNEIYLNGLYDNFLASGFNAFDMQNMLPIVAMATLYPMGQGLANFVFTHDKVAEMMQDSTIKFDIVFVEEFLADSILGFGQYYDAPVIAVSTFGSSKWTNDLIGNPSMLSFVPHTYLDHTDRMTFCQRLYSATLTLAESVIQTFYYHPSNRAIYEKYITNRKLDYTDMYKHQVALVMLNSHFSLVSPRPYLPNMIEIGGIQIDRNPKPLPEHLKTFMESAEHGVVYFSMGSTLKSANIPIEKQRALVNAFAKLKQKVIWKFEADSFQNKPNNVLIDKWMPQNDILAHPNVKLFITHGGLLGTTESIYHGVPVIGIPIFGDQKLNIARAKQNGWGMELNYDNITEETVLWSINTILSDPTYTQNVKRISQIYRDQPMTPKENVIYWTEYVVRYRGAPHLQSAGRDLSAIAYHMIDVYLFMLIAIILEILIASWIIKKLFKKLFASKKNKTE